MTDDSAHYNAYLDGERPANYTTWSGIDLKESYGPEDIAAPPEKPGEYPFTRGIHREMYRKRFWTRRQQSGFGTPEDSNQRMKFLLKEGQTGLNLNLDVPGELGLDADHPLAEGDVGLVGTSVSTLEDAERLFDGLHRICSTEQPSTRAASSSSLGTVLKVWRSRKMPKALAI